MIDTYITARPRFADTMATNSRITAWARPRPISYQYFFALPGWNEPLGSVYDGPPGE